MRYANQKDVESLTLIHYGAESFNPDLVKPIENKFVKPKGGLWASPINSKWGWKDWCEVEDFADCTTHFLVRLDVSAKVLLIDSLQDLLCLPFRKVGWYTEYLDYEAIAEKADAIWLTEKGQRETRLSLPVNLYGWDCESVLIMNPAVIREATPATTETGGE